MALTYLAIFSTFNSFVIAGSLIFLWYKKKVANHNYLLWYALFFLHNGISEFITSGIVWFLQYNKLLAVTNGLFYISTPYCLLRGSYSFANKPMSRRWWWYFISGAIIISIHEYAHYIYILRDSQQLAVAILNWLFIAHQLIASCITVWLFFMLPRILTGSYKYLFLGCLVAWATINAVTYYSPNYAIHVNSVIIIGCIKLFCGVNLIILHVCRLQFERDQTVINFYEEHTLLRAIIDNIPDYIYAKDTQGRFILSNTALTAFHQMSILGKTDFDIHSEELARQYQQTEFAILSTGIRVVNHEEPLLTPDTHETRWMSVTKLPLYNHQGIIIGIVGINRDITSLKRLNEEYQAALAIINWGKQQQIDIANEPTNPSKQPQFRYIVRAS